MKQEETLAESNFNEAKKVLEKIVSLLKEAEGKAKKYAEPQAKEDKPAEAGAFKLCQFCRAAVSTVRRYTITLNANLSALQTILRSEPY